MMKKILNIIGILLVGIASLSLLNKGLEVDSSITNKEEQLESLITKEEDLLKKVKEKLTEKYVIDIKTTSKKELLIQVVGDEKYFNSVKKDIESIAKTVIKTSTLKDYMLFLRDGIYLRCPKNLKKNKKKFSI